MLKTKYEKCKKRCLASYASDQMYLLVEEMQNIWLKKIHTALENTPNKIEVIDILIDHVHSQMIYNLHSFKRSRNNI